MDARARGCLARLILSTSSRAVSCWTPWTLSAGSATPSSWLAQAIYLHTGTLELAVAEFTIDADLTIDPTLLHASPEIEAAMRAGRFERGNRVGAWVVYRDIAGVRTRVEVDLMVPEAVGGGGRRAPRGPWQGSRPRGAGSDQGSVRGSARRRFSDGRSRGRRTGVG